MTKLVINTGTVANDGTGDGLRTAFTKVNSNFTELYSNVATLESANSTTSIPYITLTDTPFESDFEEEIYFQKTNNGSEVDNIAANVAITRGNNQGLYNPLVHVDYDAAEVDHVDGPANTEWEAAEGWADLSNIQYRTYTTWGEAVAYYPTQFLNRELVMHDIENDEYYTVKFLSWQHGINSGGAGGGGFSYIRRKIKKANFFKRPSGQPLIIDIIDEGLSLKRANNGALFNPAAGQTSYDQYNDGDYPANTRWNADGWDNLTNLESRQWLSFVAASGKYAFEHVLSKNFVMHDTTNDKYYAIKFTDWGQNGVGSFAYHRRLIDTSKLSYGIRFADGKMISPEQIPQIGDFKFTQYAMSVPSNELWIADDKQHDIVVASNSEVRLVWATKVFPEDRNYEGEYNYSYHNSSGITFVTYANINDQNFFNQWRFDRNGTFYSPEIVSIDRYSVKFYANYVNPPSTTNYTGNKVVLWDQSSSNGYSYAIGVENNNMWFGVNADDQYTTEGYKWYEQSNVVMKLDRTGRLSVNISNANIFQAGTYSKAALPPASTPGQIIYVSDDTDGEVLAFSNGTYWLRSTDRQVIS